MLVAKKGLICSTAKEGASRLCPENGETFPQPEMCKSYSNSP